MTAETINTNEKEQAEKLEAVISINGLYKSFGLSNDVLKGVNLHVNKSENLVLLGKSGSGKSIIIKCLVRLIKADKGEIKIFGTDISTLNNKELNTVRLKIGFLFQNAALYDSMSVRENMAFPLKRHFKNLSDAEADKEIESVLESVGLLEAIDKMPSELSGGMQKRAGLARTLILKPAIILYDEPTTGLDTITSREIIELILDMQKKYNTSSIIITHDMTCAKLSGDRINILKDGVIHSEGSYEELEKSDDEWVRSFFL